MIVLSDELKKISDQMSLGNIDDQKLGKCPVRELLDIIGDKWSVLIVLNLGEKGDLRFSEIMSRIPSISKRMLSRTLQELERNGFIFRNVLNHYPPKVIYGLTDLGKSLMKPIYILTEWAFINHQEVIEARNKFIENQALEDRIPWLSEVIPH